MTTQPAVEHVGFLSRSPDQTRAFGAGLGEGAEPGDVILLRGPFGAGKTTLVQGIAAGLGIHGPVTSPSFTLINEYRGKLALYHVDLFRLKALDRDLEEAIESCEGGEGLTVIEWPDMLPPGLREAALRIDLGFLGDEERSLLVHVERTRWRPGDVVALMEAALRVGDGGGESA